MDTIKRVTAAPLSSHDPSNNFLIGLRGFFVIQSFLYTFLLVFAPAAVAHSPNALQTKSSTLHKALKFVSILFWNDGVIYSGFILLSARTICIPFMTKDGGSKISIAGSVFRRGLRLWIPVAVALAIATGVFHVHGYQRVGDFADQTNNLSIYTPYKIDNALIYFNSVFNLFWVTNKFGDQAGSYAFPGQMMWVINVIYQQSFTIYMTMVIIPYTRRSWRVKGTIFFIITAWWVQSWAWYSITGLALADLATNMNFKVKAQRGIKVYRSIHLPSYIVYTVLLVAGLLMQYIWAAWRPEYRNQELVAHGGLYYTGGLNEDFDVKQPQARDDNYLVLLGFFLFVETSDILQWALANPLFVYLGRRSLSYFLVQSIIIYTLGIKLYQTIHLANNTATVAVCFLVTLITSAASAEVFYRLVEVPSHVLSHVAFDWIRE
ncbi:Nn.00g027990.m01.CDS01 [Neocucurbitaria sp. VM-36]